MTDTRIFYREVGKGGPGLRLGHSDLIGLGRTQTLVFFFNIGIFFKNVFQVILVCTGLRTCDLVQLFILPLGKPRIR